LKLNLQLLKIQKLNKTKKIWKIGGQDMEITLQLSTKMINSWFRQNQKWTLKQNPKQRQRDLKKWYHQLSLK
jgi:DNA phosphorothioation-dependent restriction protein DptG